MEVSDLKKIKDLQDENRRLKQMFADLSFENRALKDVIEKKPELSKKGGTGKACGVDVCSQRQTCLSGFFSEPDGLSLPSQHMLRDEPVKRTS